MTIPTSYGTGGLTLADNGLIYGGSLDMATIFRYDPSVSSFSRWDISSVGISRVYSLAAGLDGKLYGGGYAGYGNGRLFSFDPTTGQALSLGTAVPGDTSIRAMVRGPDGIIYGSTGLSRGYVFGYDPATSQLTLLGAPVWRDTDVLSLSVTSQGWIYGGTGWKRGHLFRFEPIAQPFTTPGEARSISISPRFEYKGGVPSTPEVWALTTAADGRVYIGGYDAAAMGKLSRWDPDKKTLELIGQVPGAPATIYDLVEHPSSYIYGAGGTGGGMATMFSYHPTSGTFDWLPLALLDESSVYALAVCPNGLVYGATGGSGTGVHGQVYAYNPNTGSFLYYGAPVGNQTAILSLICSPTGTVYGATSPDGHLFRLDPTAKSLQDLGPLVGGDPDIWALVWGPDDKIYGGTEGHGYFFVYDPATRVATIIGQPFAEDRAVYDLAVGADGLIYGVTGYMEGHLFSYDPETAILADRGQGIIDDANLYSLTLSADARHIYLGSGYNYGALIDYNVDHRFAWLGVNYIGNTPGYTDLAIDVLDLSGNVLLADAQPGTSLVGVSSTAVPAIQLRATLTTDDPDITPSLAEWSVTWTYDPKLALRPSALTFEGALNGPLPDPQTVTIDNESAGGLPWSIEPSSVPPWLAIDPPSGTAPATLTVAPDTTGLAAGVYTASLQVDGPAACINCPGSLPVSLTIYDTPLLEVMPGTLDLTAMEGQSTPQTTTLTVSNRGTGILTWTVTTTAPWLSVTPAGGVVPPVATLVVSADPAGLAAGIYTAVITVAGPPECPNCPQLVPVQFKIEPAIRRIYLPMVTKG